MIAWRTCKVRYDPWDSTGAARFGGRWNSPGRSVIYAADSFAGSLLEILAHSLRPRTLPGAHHAIRIEIPDDIVEFALPADIEGWETRDSAAARGYGDRWLEEARSAVLAVPALPCRPVGMILAINPMHAGVDRIARGPALPVPWDERLF